MIRSATNNGSDLENLLEEFAGRLEAGETLDVEAFATAHPAHAEQLRRVLPTMLVLADLGRSESGVGAAPPSAGSNSEPTPGLLGDFRIIREVGRGGMGVVHEAEQISLARRVALKVLPFAATMDPRQLQRFQNEARAAASLEHPHIVPVYAVGSERGVHYYAMKFIDGQSLAGLIRGQCADSVRTDGLALERSQFGSLTQRPSPDSATAPAAAARTERAPRDTAAFRQIAEWGVQAAEALEHAHSVGIVHRDIKPANLMIDRQGTLWVTDFGLARTAADAGLTMTGDVLGTLRYMSPEQALAKHGLVDHRTDVYSLGVTLYELLTGRPAVGGNDREEILNAITREESRTPRTLDPAIPRDLETIVLKALAKDAGERYSAARELADDLRRFLDARPIQARRPSLVQQTAKFARRHRALVWMGVAALVVVAIASATSAALVWRQKEQTREAFAEADKQRKRSETNFREAYWAIEDMLHGYDPKRTLRELKVAELKQWQTQRALRFLTAFCEDQTNEPAVRLQRGVAYVTVGRVYQARDESEKARNAFHQGIAVFGRLAKDFPHDPNYPREHATALCILGEELVKVGRHTDANKCTHEAVQILQEAVANHPSDYEAPAQLASILCSAPDPQLRDPLAAVGLARQAVELAPHVPRNWTTLGIAYYRSGQWEVAAKAFQESFREPGGARTWDPNDALLYLAMAEWRCGRPDSARSAYEQVMRNTNNYVDSIDRALRAEAAALLGIQERPTPKAVKSAPRRD